MYKLGVMSAVIMMTFFLAFKSVFIGTLILVLNLTFFAIKFGSYFKSDHHWSPAPAVHQPHGWSPPTLNHGNGWPPHKDVHLHIHNAHGKPDYSIPYSTLGNGGWDTQSNAIEQQPTWNPTGYTYSGRALSDDGVAGFPNLQPMDKSTQVKSRVIAKRDDRQPTIVMAEKQQQQQQIVTPYNYIIKPNQK